MTKSTQRTTRKKKNNIMLENSISFLYSSAFLNQTKNV